MLFCVLVVSWCETTTNLSSEPSEEPEPAPSFPEYDSITTTSEETPVPTGPKLIVTDVQNNTTQLDLTGSIESVDDGAEKRMSSLFLRLTFF